jgi:hypothetical protein
MKVKYVREIDTSPARFLTKNKTYKVLATDADGYYTIKNDRGEIGSYVVKRFDTVEGDGSMDLTIEQKVESLENQIKELKEELHKGERQEENKKKWWSPKIGEKYYTMDETGYIDETTWDSDAWDGCRFNLGNVFKTREQAERELFERQLRFKLKKFAYENNKEEINWNNNQQKKYKVYYDNTDNSLEWDIDNYTNDFNQIYFTSEKVAEKSIETFKDDLIRYFTSDK